MSEGGGGAGRREGRALREVIVGLGTSKKESPTSLLAKSEVRGLGDPF